MCARLLLHDADPSQARFGVFFCCSKGLEHAKRHFFCRYFQVDQAGRCALDYARNAGHRSTYEMLWQSQQRRIRRSAPAAPATSASPQQAWPRNSRVTRLSPFQAPCLLLARTSSQLRHTLNRCGCLPPLLKGQDRPRLVPRDFETWSDVGRHAFCQGSHRSLALSCPSETHVSLPWYSLRSCFTS